MEKQNFKVLYGFIDQAVKSRKYPGNTGTAFKTALNLFEAELNDEERNSINEVKKNLGQISNSIFAKGKINAGSLATYKSRIVKIINDYEKYGLDASKMANWSPKIISRSKKSQINHSSLKENRDAPNDNNNSFHVFEFKGVKLLIPKTSKTTEAIMDGELKKIKIELKDFSEKFCKAEELPEEAGGDKE